MDAADAENQFRKQARERVERKEALVKYITKQRVFGARLAELQFVLPALSRSQLQVLLRELVRQGRIHVRGRTKAARWHAGPRLEPE